MLNCNSIDGKLVSLADAVRAEVSYELDMNVNVAEFYRLSFEKQRLQEQFLNFNIYKYKF